MLAFEKIAYFITGIRCEPSPRGVGLRVVLGLLITSALGALAMVFAGAGAGNNNAIDSLFSLFWPIGLLYVAYLIATLFSLGRSRNQIAQYLAWSPLLLLACIQVFGMLFALVGR